MNTDEFSDKTRPTKSDPANQEKHSARRMSSKVALAVSITLNIILSAALIVGSFSFLPFGRSETHAGDSGASLPKGESPRVGSALSSRPEIIPESYDLGVVFGDLGPKLVEAGAIDREELRAVYAQSGVPLTPEQEQALSGTSTATMVLNQENARFLLHFLWAFGLTNQNPILMEGLMWTSSDGAIERFASTGGWTLSTKPITELYASIPLVSLTTVQQARLENVAANVYRPCCNNPTSFPDCNHGMAMLGLLQLLASQDASESEMYRAAKYANAYWFPTQALETAIFFDAVLGVTFENVDAQMAVGPEVFSGSGFASVHRWLGENGYLEQSPGPGSSCGV